MRLIRRAAGQDDRQDTFNSAGALTVRLGRSGAVPTIIADGRVTVDSSPLLRAALHEAIAAADAGGVVIDCSRTSYLDTSGIATLLEACVTARRRAVPLRLVGLSGEPRLLAQVISLDRIFRALGSEVEVT
jgi:anti-anti-sigma factor